MECAENKPERSSLVESRRLETEVRGAISSFTVSSLQPGTEYNLSVTVINSFGAGNPAEIVAMTSKYIVLDFTHDFISDIDQPHLQLFCIIIEERQYRSIVQAEFSVKNDVGALGSILSKITVSYGSSVLANKLIHGTCMYTNDRGL